MSSPIRERRNVLAHPVMTQWCRRGDAQPSLGEEERRPTHGSRLRHVSGEPIPYSGVTYAAVNPPSTRNDVPFTYDDSSLARNSAPLTTSRGFASRPIGQ